MDVAENEALAKKYHLQQAPSLVVSQGEEVTVYAGVARIKDYLKSVRA